MSYRGRGQAPWVQDKVVGWGHLPQDTWVGRGSTEGGAARDFRNDRQKGCCNLNLRTLPVHLQRKVKVTEGGGEMHATLMKTVSRLLGAGLCSPPAMGCTSGGLGYMPEVG